MKRFSSSWLMVFFFTLQAVFVTAQTEIPDAVQNTFDEMFPEVAIADWEEDGMEYIAIFELDEQDVEATFKENGLWLQTATTLEFEELPTTVQSYIDKEFGENIEYFSGITQMETPTVTRFFVNFETQTRTISLTFDSSGKLLKKEAEDIDEDGK